MTVRAYVADDYARFNGTAVTIVRNYDDGSYQIFEPAEMTVRHYSANEEPDIRGTMLPPTLRMPEDVARALLDALAAHFGGTSDTRQLRKDYDAERTRVDRFIAHLTGNSVR